MDECVSWSSKALYLFRQIIYWSRNIIFFFLSATNWEKGDSNPNSRNNTKLRENYENFDHHKVFWDIHIMYIIV